MFSNKQNKMEAFNREQIDDGIQNMTGWDFKNDALEKNYQFKNFRDAIAFMQRVSFEIEELNHHPEWFNVYHKLNVRLRTQDVNGITKKDHQLARKMDEHFARYGT
jgi:4a-hydroxytetrahydrobiopterin dehydratase